MFLASIRRFILHFNLVALSIVLSCSLTVNKLIQWYLTDWIIPQQSACLPMPSKVSSDLLPILHQGCTTSIYDIWNAFILFEHTSYTYEHVMVLSWLLCTHSTCYFILSVTMSLYFPSVPVCMSSIVCHSLSLKEKEFIEHMWELWVGTLKQCSLLT